MLESRFILRGMNFVDRVSPAGGYPTIMLTNKEFSSFKDFRLDF